MRCARRLNGTAFLSIPPNGGYTNLRPTNDNTAGINTQNMTRKIKGYAAHNRENRRDGETYFEFLAEDLAGESLWVKATLVIGHERVSTHERLPQVNQH